MTYFLSSKPNSIFDIRRIAPIFLETTVSKLVSKDCFQTINCLSDNWSSPAKSEVAHSHSPASQPVSQAQKSCPRYIHLSSIGIAQLILGMVSIHSMRSSALQGDHFYNFLQFPHRTICQSKTTISFGNRGKTTLLQAITFITFK